jgi:hypothetical protein
MGGCYKINVKQRECESVKKIELVLDGVEWQEKAPDSSWLRRRKGHQSLSGLGGKGNISTPVRNPNPVAQALVTNE